MLAVTVGCDMLCTTHILQVCKILTVNIHLRHQKF